MQKLWWFAMLGVSGMAFASEPPRTCFRSVAEAVAQTHLLEGVRTDGLGFRVEDLQRDVLHGRDWAMVRSCEHPERPAVAVAVGRITPLPDAAPAHSKAPLVLGGVEVRLVRLEANSRLEMRGVTQAAGALGDTVRVRVLRVGEDQSAEERMVLAVVRGADLLEMEP